MSQRISHGAVRSPASSGAEPRLLNSNATTRALHPHWFRTSVLVTALAMAGSLASATWADTAGTTSNPGQDLKQLSLEELGNVEVVSVSKEPEQIWKTPAAIFVITQEDIRRSGATSIPEALRLAPGVEVARIDANHWSVAIRGFAGQFSKSLLVLVDGRSVYTPLFEGVYWDIPYVMLSDVERIEVIRGPGGTIWGSNAVNGVINIITKPGKETRGSLATLGSGSIDQATGAFRYGASVGHDLDFRVYGMGGIRGPEFHPDSNEFDNWRLGQVGFRADWKLGDRDTFTFQGDSYNGISGESVFLSSFTPPAETPVDDKTYVSGGNLLARWQHTSSEGSDFQVQAYFDRTNRQDLELGETRDTFDVDFVQHLRIHSDQQLTWGMGARVSPSNFIQTSQGVDFLPHKQVDSIYSGFVQYEFPIVSDKLTATIGTKLEHNNFSGFEWQPSGRILWTPKPHQSVWGAVTRAVRTPSRLDQDVQFAILVQSAPPPPVYFLIQGNPRLKSEQLVGYEAGYRTEIGKNFYVDFTAFYNNYDNLQGYGAPFAEEPVTPPVIFFVLPYANVILGHTLGTEIAPTWKIRSWWEVRATYSYLHMSLRDKQGIADTGGLLGSYMGSSPANMVSFQSLFNLPRHFEIDETYRFTSKLPAVAVPSYSTADVRLGWHTRLGDDQNLEFSVSGQNLLQPHHLEFGGVDPPPAVGIKRSIYGQVTWTR
jgi:iron complex outermembrane recepter protein